jgi:hypothetical protein
MHQVKRIRVRSTSRWHSSLDASGYAFHITTIEHCLSCSRRNRFCQRKVAVKMHELLDPRASIPTFIHISDGKRFEINRLDHHMIESGACDLLDRASRLR